MKKIQIVMLSLVAVFAFSAFAASSAFAAEWLLNGAKIEGKAVAATTEGELLLEDTGNKGAVVCEGILDGTVGPGATDTITEVLTLAGVKVKENLEGEGLLCTKDTESACEASTTDIEVFPVGLPWSTTLSLSGTIFVDTVKKAGYEVKCLVLGIGITDECTVTNGAGEVKSGATDVEVLGEISPLGHCSIGGEGTGKIQSLAGDLITTTSGTLAVSE